jgi:hypothetical protein
VHNTGVIANQQMAALQNESSLLDGAEIRSVDSIPTKMFAKPADQVSFQGGAGENEYCILPAGVDPLAESEKALKWPLPEIHSGTTSEVHCDYEAISSSDLTLPPFSRPISGFWGTA